jgi:hypothetical protein
MQDDATLKECFNILQLTLLSLKSNIKLINNKNQPLNFNVPLNFLLNAQELLFNTLK